MATRFHIMLPEPARARGIDPALAFTAQGAEEFAVQLQDALRTPALFERWRMAQDDPDEVDPKLGITDPSTTVEGRPDDLHVDLIVVTSIPGDILRHRLRLLAGNAWELRDVSSA
jgi:hypothetical protein